MEEAPEVSETGMEEGVTMIEMGQRVKVGVTAIEGRTIESEERVERKERVEREGRPSGLERPHRAFSMVNQSTAAGARARIAP